MSKRTVLKVDTSCVKCKRKVLQAVSGLQGVDKIEIDSVKSTMTVTGSVDPVDVIVQTRKAGKRADVVTIGPPSRPEEKTPEPQKKPPKQQQQQEKKYSAAVEQKAPEPPMTVYVHHVPSTLVANQRADGSLPAGSPTLLHHVTHHLIHE